MSRRIGTWVGVAVAAAAAGRAPAQIQNVVVGTGFTNPVFAASAPGDPGRLYVAEQGGRVRSLTPGPGASAAGTLLDLSAIPGLGFVSGGERGLLGLAFHPDFSENGHIYVQYTHSPSGSGHRLRVDQFTVSNGAAAAASRRTVIEYDHPNFSNHNAGWLGFRPTDPDSARGHLFIATGDGGGSNDPGNNAQNTNSLLGKILRVDVGGGLSAANPTYAAPSTNPFAGATAGRDEIFAYGLRNPYRAGFDRQTGDLYIGDVGQNNREEVDFIGASSNGGQNFGWRLREGTIATPTPVGNPVGGNRPAGNVDPIAEYAHTTFGRSITGGYVYRGPATDDAGNPLDGTYFFGDYISGRVLSTRYNGTSATAIVDRTAELGFTPGTVNLSSFAEDGFGNLFAIGYNTGAVYQIVPVPEPAAVGLAAGAVGLWVARRRRPAGG